MWTREQQSVIDSRDCNLLVAAAAGSGKTAVMIERIIQRIMDIEDPVDIDKILVVTFTNAAANEMKERVRSALEKELEKDPLNSNLQRQMSLLNMASICTIDSFCRDVILENIHATDLNYSVKIADPAEIEMISYEVIEDLFEELYEEEDEEFIGLVDYYSDKNTDEDLAKIIISLNNFVNSSPDPEAWLDNSAEFFNNEEKGDEFYIENFLANITKDIGISIGFIKNRLSNLIDEIISYEDLKPYVNNVKKRLNYASDMSNLIYGFNSMVRNGSYNVSEAIEIWNNIHLLIQEYKGEKFENFRSSKKMDPIAVDAYNMVKDDIKLHTNDLEDCFATLLVEIDDIKYENEKIYSCMRGLSNLCKKFRDVFSKKKRSMGIIDFPDVEHYALNILTDYDGDDVKPSKIAQKYINKFIEVYTDEYQDINQVQEHILSMVSKEDNRFMVGDVKQSIYRFRQAMPEIFMTKYNYYELFSKARETSEDSNNHKDGNNEVSNFKSINKKILLYKNFRSRKDVLEGCNHVFSMIMNREVGELDYTEEERLNTGAVFEEEKDAVYGGPIEVCFLDGKKSSNTSSDGEDGFGEDVFSMGDGVVDDELEGFKKESAYIATIIDDMVNNKDNKFVVYDKDEKRYRRVMYKDIVILVRSLKSKVSDMEEVFLNYGIPIYSDFGDGYFDTLEVDTIINLLKIIDNPISDIELVSVMRSPIFKFDSIQLSKIRMSNFKFSYYEAMMEYIEKIDMEKLEEYSNSNVIDEDLELQIKVLDFISTIDRYRKKSVNMVLSDFIWYLLKETGYLSYVSMLENGESRKNNLLLLFEKARQYEKTSFNGLFNFINYIDRIKSKNTNLSEAKIVPEDFNMVRVMTIHKSKGLEFPVVIVANALSGFNMRPEHSKISLHQSMGYGPSIFDKEMRVKYDSLYKKIMTKRKEYENIAEEMRLLYVAMTRAKEKLIFTSYIKDYEKSYYKWVSTPMNEDLTMNSKSILNAKSYLNWIMPTIINLSDRGEEYCSRGFLTSTKGYKDCKWQIVVDDLETIKRRYVEKNEVNRLSVTEEIESKNLKLVNMLKDNVLELDEREKIRNILIDQLEYRYSYNSTASKPSRISVTDIKNIKNKRNSIDKEKMTDEIGLADKEKMTGEIGLTDTEKIIAKGNLTDTDKIKDEGSLTNIEVEKNEENNNGITNSNIILEKPRFMQDSSNEVQISSAERGSIFHLVLQLMDFSVFNQSDEKNIDYNIEKTIKRLVDDKIITLEQSKVVNRRWLKIFIKNPMFLRLQDAIKRNRLYKEKAINYSLDLSEVYDDIEANIDNTMLVGIIDIFFEKEDNTYVLIDYKTDYVKNNNIGDVVDKYRIQLEMYKKAMEGISGKKVSEVYLFLVSIGRCVRIV